MVTLCLFASILTLLGALTNVIERYNLDLGWTLANEDQQIRLTFKQCIDFNAGFDYRPAVINVVPGGTEHVLRDANYLSTWVESAAKTFILLNVDRGFVDAPDLPVKAFVRPHLVHNRFAKNVPINALLKPHASARSKNVLFRNVLQTLKQRFSAELKNYNVVYTILGLMADAGSEKLFYDNYITILLLIYF